MTTQRKLGPITNHNIIIGPEPDQSTPTSYSDQADFDSTAATTYNTGKRTEKGEMEDVYRTWSDAEKDELASFLEADPAFHVHLGLEFSSK